MKEMEESHSCECEHISHFPEDHGSSRCCEPYHGYAAVFKVSEMREHKTAHGIYRVCKHCAESHLKEYLDGHS